MSERLTGEFIADGENRAHALAGMFCEMASDLQAEFFNRVAEISAKWPNARIMQWRWMQQHLSEGGKTILNEMKDHTDQESSV